MATYVNDLRLKEIATGDEAGTWGTSTNTNLELIAEAFSFGTEAITTNADTHTTTIADGSTDPGRSIYLKYTGTLDSACTITIGPNTVSKLWFIENGTSGSQNIIISQGSGANITIPAGDVKAVYSDGAGSGAAIVDAFASLNVVDLKVEDDLTVTDDVAIGGLATVGGTLGVTGVVTANAGVVVDNITIDGQEIDVSSGNLTLDVAGEIKLDSDDGVWRFQDNGGSLIELSTGSGSSPTFFTAVSDADLVFRGNDGGSAVTALTLDMSDGGTAIFGSWQKMADNNRIVFGAGSDMSLFSDGTDGNILVDGNLSVDVSGDIILDADGADIKFADGGTEFADHFLDGNDYKIQTTISNGDFVIVGNDGGSSINALTLDMSDAGVATFNSSVVLKNLLSISSDSTSAFLQTGSDVLQFGTSSSDPLTIFTNNTERMRINSSGRVLIGRTSALQSDNMLSVEGSGTGAGNAILDVRNTSSSDTCGVIALSKASTTTDSSGRFIYFFANNFGTNMGAIAGNGSGNVAFVATSDERLKENIKPISGSLDKVLALNPVSFNWKENGEHIEAGFVAQEVEKVLPEYTVTDDDEIKTKNLTGGMTSGYIAVLTKAIQEQQEQIESLKSEIAILKGE